MIIQVLFQQNSPKKASQEYHELRVQGLGLVAAVRGMGHALVQKFLVAEEDGSVVYSGMCDWSW